MQLLKKYGVILLCVIALGCHTTRKTTCPPEVMCTRIFKSVVVQVKNTEGTPVTLDDTYTVNVNTGETIRLEGTGEPGYYIVLNDSYQKKIVNTTAQFQFIGVKNGQRVVDEPYRIGADCCHIEKVSGQNEITVK